MSSIASPLLAVAAAAANATSNVLQRGGNRHEQDEDEFSLRLLGKLVRDKVWLAGLAAVLASFFIQAAALGLGQLSEVEPLVVLELPMTLIAGVFFFDAELHRREWGAIAAMTAGVVGLILCLGPKKGQPLAVTGVTWAAAIVLTAGVAAALFCLARFRDPPAGRQAANLGAAAGVTFGLTSALTKGATAHLESGIVGLFTTWQTYLLVPFGLLSMWLLQQAFNSGRLVAAQPGITLADPLVAILWGTIVFHEPTHGALLLAFAALFALLMGAGGVLLAGSSETSGAAAESEDGGSEEAA